MKKNLCLILALLLALSLLLTACGGDAEVSGSVTSNDNPSSTVPAGKVEQEELPTSEPTVPETTAPENELSLGRMEGGIYTNEYVGYACTLDSNWTFLSAKELEQIPSTVSDAVSGTELGDALADVQQFTDMMAENVTDLTTMNVLYQKLSMQERLAYAVVSEEDVIDATLDQASMMIDAYAQAGILVTSMEKVNVTFMGEERFAIYTVSTLEGIPYYSLQFFDYDLGAYAVTTTLASYVEDQTGDLCDLFYKLEN